MPQKKLDKQGKYVILVLNDTFTMRNNTGGHQDERYFNSP